MTPLGRPVEEDDLHARIDGQLARDRAEDVDAYLAAHPEDQARFSQYAGQRQALRQAFAEQADGPIPARLRIANLLAQQRRRRLRQLRQIAAAAGLILLGGIGGWAARDLGGPLRSLPPGAVARMITADAISAYLTFSGEARHPVEVDAGQEVHLVQWLSKRLGRQLVVPDLASVGFRLMGGRLLPSEEGPAAQFMYENGNADRVTLYLRTGVSGETAFRYHEEGGVGAFYWSDEGFGYAITAKADRDLLLRIAEIVYQQTSPGGAKAKIPPAPGKPS
jgi:anti-sigma factor RsiW